MNFSFNEISEISSNSRKQLEGNKIHEVTFDGCELRDIQGVQDASKVFKVLDIKFSNEEGVFTDTVWEPKDTDMQDTPNSFGGMNPSNMKQMMFKFKHLIDAVNPELGKAMSLPKDDPNHKEFNISNWDSLRKFMVQATENNKGAKTKIKLLSRTRKNQDGTERQEAQFPGFFLSYSRDGKLYMSSNFIGNNIFFTNKELNRIKNSQTAAPTTVEKENKASEDFNFDF